MKAAVFSGIKPEPPYVQLQDIPEPTPTTGDVVVEVIASTVVPYVSEIFSGVRNFPSLLPIVPGPSSVGVITSVGPGITSLEPGQLVYCDPTIRARDDYVWGPAILLGAFALGPKPTKLQSVWRNGGWAERVLLPAENVIRIPPSITLSPAELAVLNIVSIPYGGLYEGGVRPGSTIVITGATGFFGSGAVAVAVAMGVRRVIACGRNAEVLQRYVKLFGNRVSPVVLSGDEAKDSAAISEAAGEGFKIDVVFDILPPTAPFSFVRSAISALRAGGTVILMGGLSGNVDLPYLEFIFKGITIKGAFMCPRHAYPELLGLIEAGLLDLKLFTTKEFSLDRINEAILYAKEHPGAFESTVVNLRYEVRMSE